MLSRRFECCHPQQDAEVQVQNSGMFRFTPGMKVGMPARAVVSIRYGAVELGTVRGMAVAPWVAPWVAPRLADDITESENVKKEDESCMHHRNGRLTSSDAIGYSHSSIRNRREQREKTRRRIRGAHCAADADALCV